MTLRRLSRVLAIVLCLTVVGFISLPIGRYLLRGAWEEAKILARRRPIEEVIRDTTVDADTRNRLRLVLDVRTFAAESLGLHAGASFTTYTRLDHDTLVLVVSAAERDRLQPHTWWFPIVGRVPYKGFFDFGQALRAASGLRSQDLDTYVRPASAFSTLGWFDDPLVSTTLRLDSLALTITVIHELTHNTVFVPDQVAFNESLASFAGAQGAMAFFRARGSSQAASSVAQRWEDEKLLASFWKGTKASIESTFAANPDDRRARLAGRDTVYSRMRSILLDTLAPRMPTYPRESLANIALDNASLLAHQVYASEPWLFDEALRRNGGDLRATIGDVASLVRDAGDPFAVLRNSLLSASPSRERTSGIVHARARPGDRQ
ncbi:MAG: hypothetical protein MNPFHGCM_01314 [Gemmatimonadaceae bacterium]|nr:hypothetical protein [Gemmatimonadaceae bacterium]